MTPQYTPLPDTAPDPPAPAAVDGLALLADRYGQDIPDTVAYLKRAFPDLAAEAEDIAHDALLAVRKKIVDAANPRAYLRKAAHNLALKAVLKRNGRVLLADDDTGLHTVASDDPAAEAAWRVTFEQLLATLTPRERTVAVYQIIEGLGPKEIAERMGIAEGSVKSLQHRIRANARGISGNRKGGVA
ncbi:RNA polymerase sigma factor [Uniformispora flossi]|uniref:RNA polymerase sigma factor n=1 Tax=Uniformispora flossi TaxID=3390723 RepID=UPI003C2F9A5C